MFSEERFCSFSILSRKIHGGGHELSKGIGILRTEEREKGYLLYRSHQSRLNHLSGLLQLLIMSLSPVW